MATLSGSVTESLSSEGQLRLARFEIDGLFGGPDMTIHLPVPEDDDPNPQIMILSGANGAGKTTILKMIGGMLGLDFEICRQVPFDRAALTLSNGESLVVYKNLRLLPDAKEDDIIPNKTPLFISYEGISTYLGNTKSENQMHEPGVSRFRSKVLPILSGVNYDLLTVDRAAADPIDEDRYYHPSRRHEISEKPLLSHRVKGFMSEAQVNYRKFFRATELDLLPRILNAIRSNSEIPTQNALTDRIETVRRRAMDMRRYGLQTDSLDIQALSDLLKDEQEAQDLKVISTYVEMQESVHEGRELIARRVIAFEEIMDDFLRGKSIRVDANQGLIITTAMGVQISEKQLSSGEYHFLYMMVSALLCQRTGSVIAIDEPELSLHVSWQRKLVSALAKCASGASPLFLLATHSIAISAQHRSSVYEISDVD